MRGLRGRVTLVTGAGQGIGRAIARRLGAEGARVAVTDPGSVLSGVAAVQEKLGTTEALVTGQTLSVSGGLTMV